MSLPPGLPPPPAPPPPPSLSAETGPVIDSDKFAIVADEESGMVFNHVYAVLDVFVLYRDNQMVKLVKLRNPQGKGEWKKNWSRNDKTNWTEDCFEDVLSRGILTEEDFE